MYYYCLYLSILLRFCITDTHINSKNKCKSSELSLNKKRVAFTPIVDQDNFAALTSCLG